jgi:hypothetical protein
MRRVAYEPKRRAGEGFMTWPAGLARGALVEL